MSSVRSWKSNANVKTRIARGMLIQLLGKHAVLWQIKCAVIFYLRCKMWHGIR